MTRVSILIGCAALLAACSNGASSSSGDGGSPPSPDGIFPADNPWNTDISTAEVDPMSDQYIQCMSPTTGLHNDFDAVGDGIPYVVVPGNQPLVPVSFDYADESDPGPYPIPDDAPVEPGDQHVLV